MILLAIASIFGYFWCAFVHIWFSWIKVIGVLTGKTWIICRSCGRVWTL